MTLNKILITALLSLSASLQANSNWPDASPHSYSKFHDLTPTIIVKRYEVDKWPFTAIGGRITCENKNSVVFTDNQGNDYALNGSAKNAGYQDIDAIWLYDPLVTTEPAFVAEPEYANIKVNHNFINLGLKICGY